MLCDELRLPVYNKMTSKVDVQESRTGDSNPGVHFYGFRQIEENPIFYSLADAFILPSSLEEWGLVVNEAMSCGLPVVVSEKAGCVEDLLRTVNPPSIRSDGLTARKAPSPPTNGYMRQNGFTFDPKSVETLTAALLALDADPALRQSMGQASRFIVADYSCDRRQERAARRADGDGPRLARKVRSACAPLRRCRRQALGSKPIVFSSPCARATVGFHLSIVCRRRLMSGLTLLRIVRRQRPVHQLGSSSRSGRITSCASSRIVNSRGLPMLIGPVKSSGVSIIRIIPSMRSST